MPTIARAIEGLSDERLLATVETLTVHTRQSTADLIEALAELDRRELHLAQGYSSLFSYCTSRLHFSEHEAYARIRAARLAQSFPAVISMIAEGRLTLTAVCLLAPFVTVDNHECVLREASYKTRREVEEQIAALRPLPAVPSVIYRIPGSRELPNALSADAESRVGSSPEGTHDTRTDTSVDLRRRVSPRCCVTPLSADTYKVQVTISREAYEILRRIQDLMRHVVPSGDPAVIIERGLQALLADLERRKTAHTERPHRTAPCNSGTRYVPAHVRREVWDRDGAQCAFVGLAGRCQERGFLEFHHVVPYADGGETSVDNLELRCRSHNVYEAELHAALLEPRDVTDD